MNQIIYNLMLVNFSGMIFYICYLIFTKIKKEDNIEVLFKTSNYEQFRKIINKRITIYIIGVLCGLIILVLYDTKIIKNINSKSKYLSENDGLCNIFVKE